MYAFVLSVVVTTLAIGGSTLYPDRTIIVNATLLVKKVT